MPTLSPDACGLCEEKGVVSVAGGAVQRIAAFGKCASAKGNGRMEGCFAITFLNAV